jgi:phosphohistidine phosphatase SixA
MRGLKLLGIGLLAAAGLAAGCAQQPVHAARPSSAQHAPPGALPRIHAKIIYLVRHADRGGHDAQDPGPAYDQLTPEGWATARKLAHYLSGAGITRIVTTNALRTQETAYATQEMLTESGRPPVLDYISIHHDISEETPIAGAIAHLAQTCRDNDVVLFVYHHSEIPGFLDRVVTQGQSQIPKVSELATEYDNLFILTPAADGNGWVLRREHFGAAR